MAYDAMYISVFGLRMDIDARSESRYTFVTEVEQSYYKVNNNAHCKNLGQGTSGDPGENPEYNQAEAGRQGPRDSIRREEGDHRTTPR